MKLKKIDCDAPTAAEINFLYSLLSERLAKPNINISHQRMPTYTEHVTFIKSHPYAAWYIIKVGHDLAGSIYLTDRNEVGIFIADGFRGRGIGKQALETLRTLHPYGTFYANINPKNVASINFFTGMGYEIVQYTFKK
jgi:RimJ/RimL family protein N-acetyltransferase